MGLISRFSVVGAVAAAVFSLSACYTPTCDTALRLSTLKVDFTAFPNAGSGLDFEINCPGKSSCSDKPAGTRYDAQTENEVGVLPEVQAVQVLVYEKGSSRRIAERSLDPVPWDPPARANSCPTPAKATMKL